MMMYAFFAAWHILAAEALDTDMNTQEKKQTGVYKLTDKEKAALQQWIDSKYEKKGAQTESPAQPLKSKHPLLSENLQGSQYLKLSDNSLWKVRPEDIPIAQGWITPVEIIVTQSANPFFPYNLMNTVTGSSIQARKIDKLPQPGSPPLAPENLEQKQIPGSPPKASNS